MKEGIHHGLEKQKRTTIPFPALSHIFLHYNSKLIYCNLSKLENVRKTQDNVDLIALNALTLMTLFVFYWYTQILESTSLFFVPYIFDSCKLSRVDYITFKI